LRAWIALLLQVGTLALQVVNIELHHLGQDAAHRHDPAPRRGKQHGHHLGGEREVPEMVGSHGQLEPLPGRPAFPPGRSDAGVLDQRVEAVQPDELGGRRRHGLQIGEIQRDRGDVGVDNPPPNGLDGDAYPIPVPAKDHHIGAGRGELLGDEIADTRVAAGDRICPARQIRQGLSVPGHDAPRF
jgi:hypothetical protein